MIHSLHATYLPSRIALGATGGPKRQVDIVTLQSGHEKRATRWHDSRRSYNIGYGVRSLADLEDILVFFEERRGQLHAFLWHDRLDHQSCPLAATPGATDQQLGEGTGAQRVFPLVKQYGDQYAPYKRRILCPVADSVIVAVDGAIQTREQDYTLHANHGLIVFAANKAPGSGAKVTAGFRFAIPVRFDNDQLLVDHTSFEAGQVPDIPLLEVRLPDLMETGDEADVLAALAKETAT